MTMLSGLYPGVEYNCSIVARNGAGPSDPVYISGTTLETGTSVYVVRIHYLMLYVTNLIPTLSPCVDQTSKGKWPCMILFNCHHAALSILLLVICAHMQIKDLQFAARPLPLFRTASDGNLGGAWERS